MATNKFPLSLLVGDSAVPPPEGGWTATTAKPLVKSASKSTIGLRRTHSDQSGSKGISQGEAVESVDAQGKLIVTIYLNDKTYEHIIEGPSQEIEEKVRLIYVQ